MTVTVFSVSRIEVVGVTAARELKPPSNGLLNNATGFILLFNYLNIIKN